MFDAQQPFSACQFFVEDVVASKRYVVTLRPEDMPRVRCRTIRRHLAQSAGFPYLAHEFDLYCDASSSRSLDEDATGASMGLRSGTVLLLQQKKLNAAATNRARESASPKLAAVRTSSCEPDYAADEDGEWMSGLSERQRKLQAQLLHEFRRSSDSPSPPPQIQQPLFPATRSYTDTDTDDTPSTYVVGKGWVGDSTVLTSTLVPSRSASQNVHSASQNNSLSQPHHQHNFTPPPSRRSESLRYEMTPDVDLPTLESPQLVGTSQESLHGTPPVAAHHLQGQPKNVLPPMQAEAPLPAASSHEFKRLVSNQKEGKCRDEGEEFDTLYRQIESLTQRVQSLTSANAAAQQEIFSLHDDLSASSALLESETNRANTLHDAAVQELRQQLGFKFVKSQADFDVIVRNFAKKKELEAKCARATESQKELMTMLQAEQAKRRALQSFVEDVKGNIRVVIRIRPSPPLGTRGGGHSHDDPTIMSHPPNDAVLIADTAKGLLTVQSVTNGTKAFEFYKVLGGHATQHDVFAEVAPLVQSAVDGHNVCVFAYGQTGSGKTFTMLGNSPAHHHQHDAEGKLPFTSQKEGIIPRAVADLFRLVHERIDSESCIMCSLVELYNEQLFDMLAQESNEKLEVRPLHSLAASMHQVRTVEEALHLLAVGGSTRRIHETKLNMHSSRSHLVFSMHIAMRNSNRPDGPIQESKMTFVDLAGSERVAHTQSVGDRLKEAQYINKSLSALGDVIASLSSQEHHHVQQQQHHVPYRNSKLTLLLQDCIGGHSKTMLLACIAPTSVRNTFAESTRELHNDEHVGNNNCTTVVQLTNLQETISTLQFAARVRLVRNGLVSKTSSMKYVASAAAAHATSSLSHSSLPMSNNMTNQLSGIPSKSAASLPDGQPAGGGLKAASVNQPRSHSKTPKRSIPMKF
ncbi:kinesin, putative [Bodo saltans]|uniref:Kinesin-like protein n=1 Tax=Bodo saltans TaxID=75058 RepID=A0A0S4JQF7_BODSA|nr:kinesin, putative [Bodo saltans]|eukprot:CUG92982.1 kinesin, putative [Bodo saltans]